MTVLFLDFDGVLHKAGCKPTEFFSRMPLLEAWLLQHRDVDVVISSTWRLTRTLHELKGLFPPELAVRIVGVTPKVEVNNAERFAREAEVLMWLRQSGQPWRSWVALDDQAWLFRPFNRRLVVCNADTGLTEDVLVRLSTLVDERI